MKVRIADSAGFCMGVRKAMDTVLDASRGREVTYTLGPLIHNPQAVKMLESRNIFAVKDVDATLTGKTVVTRAHGITLDMRRRLDEACADVVDATCPKVLRSQAIIRRYVDKGHAVVIVGDRGHAEVDALMSYTDGRGVVVESLAEARELPRYEAVCVVAQTTFNESHYRAIADEICTHATDCHVAKTVCSSTERRQADIPILAETTDATVVVGGRNSANTCRLVQLSLDLGQPTFHIEDPTELDLEELSQYTEIGVTAGASTPSWVIKQVVDSIAGYTPNPKKSLVGFMMTIAFFAIEGNFVICGGAAALTYAMCLFMGIPPEPSFALIALLYLFPLHTVNKYLEITWNQITSERHHRRLQRYWSVYLSIAALSALASLVGAWMVRPLMFGLVAVSYLLGGLYSKRIVPAEWNWRFMSLRDIPGSKDVVTAAAWTFAIIVLPVFAHGSFPGLVAVIAGAIFVFIFVFTRMTLLALGGIQSDRIVGIETIPALIGKNATLRLLYWSLALMATGLVSVVLTGFVRPGAIIQTAPVAYLAVCISLLARKRHYFSLYHQMTVDAAFYLAGVLGWLFLS